MSSLMINATSMTLDRKKTRQAVEVGLMLGRCRRRWANIKTALWQRLVFAGLAIIRYHRVEMTQFISFVTRWPKCGNLP